MANKERHPLLIDPPLRTECPFDIGELLGERPTSGDWEDWAVWEGRVWDRLEDGIALALAAARCVTAGSADPAGYVIELIDQTRPPRKKSATNPRNRISATLRWEVYKRDDFRCRSCGTQDRLSCDHIFPASKGGKTNLANLQTLCRPCNSRKGVRT